MTWRVARAAEDPIVLRMMRALYDEDPSPVPVPDPQMKATLEVFRREPLRGRTVVLEHEGELVGYALLCSFWSNELGGEVCNVDEVYVAPQHRSQGATTALVEHLLRGELWTGRPVAIDLEVTPANTRAEALYLRLGFERTKNQILRRLPR